MALVRMRQLTQIAANSCQPREACIIRRLSQKGFFFFHFEKDYDSLMNFIDSYISIRDKSLLPLSQFVVQRLQENVVTRALCAE